MLFSEVIVNRAGWQKHHLIPTEVLGAAARYAASIVAMLDDTIARPMPPFGLSATRPTELCRIAAHIGGPAAAAARAKPFCARGYLSGDGAPRDF